MSSALPTSGLASFPGSRAWAQEPGNEATSGCVVAVRILQIQNQVLYNYII